MNPKRLTIAIVGAEIVLAAGFGSLAMATPHVAYAAPSVNLSAIPDIDSLPVCALEDCSDQPGQTGVWLDRDTGNWYLERGELTWLIVDDTTTPGEIIGPDTPHLGTGALPGPVA